VNAEAIEMSTAFNLPVEEFRHEALMYAGMADFLAGTLPFVRGGLEAGEPVLVVESAAKIAMLRAELGPDADAVLFADMAGVGANPARIIPAWRDFVTRHGGAGRRLRGIGEPIWNGRSSDELAECQRHESLLNTAFATGDPWWLLCPYDTTALDPAVIEEARRSHPFVTDGETFQHSNSYRGLGASGAPFDLPLPEPSASHHEISFLAGGLAEVRAGVTRDALGAGLPSSRVADLVLAVNEVATNSIVHGGGKGILRTWSDPDAVICEVRDSGFFDRPLVDRERPSPEAPGPRGLWLANQLCDLVQIRSLPGGTAVRLHMKLKPPAVRQLGRTPSIDNSELNPAEPASPLMRVGSKDGRPKRAGRANERRSAPHPDRAAARRGLRDRGQAAPLSNPAAPGGALRVRGAPDRAAGPGAVPSLRRTCRLCGPAQTRPRPPICMGLGDRVLPRAARCPSIPLLP
jgi:anti-sigma regulatory factor (Ser/Thr protein kinase)